MKRLIAMTLAVMTLMLLMCGAAVAEEKPSLQPYDLWEGYRSIVCRVNNLPDDAVITSAKSSKTSVLQVKLDDGIIMLRPMKAGKAKVTVKYKTDGKTKSVKATYTVNKYPKPLSSLLINGLSISQSKYKYFYEMNNYEPVKTQINFKPSSGWTVSEARVDINNPAGPTKRLTLTSGKTFSIPDGCDADARISLVNKKGQKLNYLISFYR